MYKSWWKQAKQAAQEHWVWALTIASVATLLVSPLVENENIKQLIQKITFVTLASGVAGAVIRSSTFTEMFIERIVDVFYDDRHLKSRNDLSQICTRTLNALLATESPALRGAVGEELLNEYLNFQRGFVYKDYRIQLQIINVDRVNGIIKLMETVSAIIIPNNGRNEIEITWSWSSPYTTIASAELFHVSLNGHEIPQADFSPKKDGSGNISSSYTYKIPKTSSNEMQQIAFVRRVMKVIEVRKDPVLTYVLSVPALDMSMELIDFPENILAAQFDSFGLPRGFIADRKDGDGLGHWRSKRYTGLIFPKQGAILQWFLK